MLTFVSEPLESKVCFVGTSIGSVSGRGRTVSHRFLRLVGGSSGNTRRSDFIHVTRHVDSIYLDCLGWVGSRGNI